VPRGCETLPDPLGLIKVDLVGRSFDRLALAGFGGVLVDVRPGLQIDLVAQVLETKVGLTAIEDQPPSTPLEGHAVEVEVNDDSVLRRKLVPTIETVSNILVRKTIAAKACIATTEKTLEVAGGAWILSQARPREAPARRAPPSLSSSYGKSVSNSSPAGSRWTSTPFPASREVEARLSPRTRAPTTSRKRQRLCGRQGSEEAQIRRVSHNGDEAIKRKPGHETTSLWIGELPHMRLHKERYGTALRSERR